MPNERTRAVVETRAFLEMLACQQYGLRSPAGLQKHAEALLRHYPNIGDMRLTAFALPLWWSSPDDLKAP